MDAEGYKAEQIQRMNNLIVGSNDPTGSKITKIFSKGDEYLVYEVATKNSSESIKVLIDTQIEDDTEKADNFSMIRGKFTRIKGMLYKVTDDTSIKTRISHITSHGINGKPDEANKQFDELIEEIEIEYTNQSKHRINFIFTTMLIVIVSVIISSFIYHQNLLQDTPIIRDLVFTTTGALIGGFISISRKLKSIIFQKDISNRIYVFYSIERMLIASLAGATLYFAIKSNIVFGLIKELENPIYGYILFSTAAGFSETLIPNLLIKLEKESS